MAPELKPIRVYAQDWEDGGIINRWLYKCAEEPTQKPDGGDGEVGRWIRALIAPPDEQG